jgi:hypothetical protein
LFKQRGSKADDRWKLTFFEFGHVCGMLSMA